MNIYEYNDYKQWVNDWVSEQERGGHGQLRKLAEHLRVNSVVMSQIFRGDRDLSPEQALGVTKFLGLTTLERDYFLLLVQYARAGTQDLKIVYESQLAQMRLSANTLKNRVPHQKLSDEGRATFYSNWYYSAVRLGLSIPRLNQISKIATHLDLSTEQVAQIVEFLLEHKLLNKKDGELVMGPQVTHIGHDSPFVHQHHTNWRMRGLQTLTKSSNNKNLFYTGPMALSNDAADSIRKLLVDLVEKSTKKAAQSDSETLNCLNIDWFHVGSNS